MSTGEETAQSLFEMARQHFYAKNTESNAFELDNEEGKTLSVKDNRTGRKYEFNIKSGCITGNQLARIKFDQEKLNSGLRFVDTTMH